MNRERELAQAFVDLADTYASDFDPLVLFSRLVHTCRGRLEVDAAAVMIADGRGTLKTMAATEDGAAFIELLQTQTGRGPCMDCFRTGEARGIPDITAERDRWPKLVPAMLDNGYRALHTVPLRLHDRPLGAVTLLNARVGNLSDGDAHLAQALADSAALSLMHWSTEPARVDDVITRVQSAIAAKTALEIAKGMIAVYGNIEVGEAGRRLTDYARHHRVSLADTAHALVSRTMDPTVIVGDPHGS
ncbi:MULTISPECIES: GAF and ANTAR domain-containing protein [Streptomyces]|uniref:GAF and ANTAR domain-containing protein n=2 Tax=Streptomyces bobili TaxID=67280 RepID=A0ABZ1R0F0_9ACTN|nr:MULTISPECIES: GAF and ANTAR domain-containing protein [Streptomyces]QEU66882.1 ANTAR domain-containing protein [Streptomyces galilaeus]GGW67600.1 GAF domain-containing protein [Streptomyces galilaeus]